MNRPEKANGMTPDFWTELPRLLAELETDESVRAVILSGEGRHFTGGMDLAAFGSIAALFEQEPGRAAYALRDKIMQLQDAFTAIECARFPVIAAIHGACIGGGIDMISACDMRLATSNAYFSIEEINIGMTADVGTLQRLPKIIAPAIVAELAYTGRRFSAEDARGYGLLSQLCETREQLMAETLALAEQISTKSPLAIAGVKRNLSYSRDHGVADGLDYMATWNAGMLRAEDLMNAVQASMAKKEAVFSDLLSENSLAI
ncbi:MAG: crotonase/enoyl-CoA hydratase family protein [Hyphomicrobiales bacterium]|nr:crotonase/enoyl-CoA hydratase family protein [Hyphomicrobiales bacterium]MCP5001495.1 crotonase/enoyl-CoA hydratase family protein [Hyphomicrobiales bacterium]